MWLATKYGFFSVVRNIDFRDRERDGARAYIVRTRRKADLEGLLQQVDGNAVDTGRITVTMEADYPARVFVSQQEWEGLMQLLADSIDYSNFKSKIAATPEQNKDKHAAYAEIWGVMYRTGDRREKE